MSILWDIITENSLVMSFLFVGAVILGANLLSKYVFRGRLHPSAIAIFAGLAAAYVGGMLTGGEKGISDLALFSGVGILGSSMFRDFAIISTAFGADLQELKRCGKIGVISLVGGVAASYLVGAILAVIWGYRDAKEVAVIASGAVTFIVGPVVASTLGVTSEAVAVSIAAGVIKSIVIMIGTPLVAKQIGLTSPRAAMVYGAMMATFYTGTGCLLCPTVLYGLTSMLL